MDSRPIGFFDSGLGGLPYLARVKERLPEESFAYLADSAHFPYGEKSADEVRSRVLAGIGLLCAVADPKLVVVACNTASVVALDELRRKFRIPFVGVVPAVKPAAERSERRRIGLLATSRTVDDRYLEGLIESFAADCEVVRLAAGDLVRFVEYDYLPGAEEAAEAALRPLVRELKESRVDAVVLGCTHFTHLEGAIGKAMGASVAIIDSRDGVARQVGRLLDPGPAGSKERDSLYLTGDAVERYRRFAALYGLDYRGRAA